MKKLFYILIFLNILNSGFCQQQTKQALPLIQFSGLVLTYDSNLPVPYAMIKIMNTYRGTIANVQGFFTIVVQAGEVAEITSVGFKTRDIKIPTNTRDQKYTIIIPLETDTLTFNETYIYPLPPKGKFIDAFVNLELNKTETDRLRDNMSERKMISLRLNMAMDGQENQELYMKNMATMARYNGGQTNYGQFPGFAYPVPLSLLNPFAWVEFIRDLKAGKLKDKYKDLRE